MKYEFPIYTGNSCGNSFVICDLRNQSLPNLKKSAFAIESIKKYNVDSCLYLSQSKNASLQMEIFEQDGSQSDTCGNGMLLVSFLLNEKQITFETKGGVFEAGVTNEKTWVRLKTRTVTVAGLLEHPDFLHVKSGEPHLVSLVNEISDDELQNTGRIFQDLFPSGVNVNFISKIDETIFNIRTYERGVENITMSCGTGTLSSYTAINYFYDKIHLEMIEFRSKGGVHWVTREDETIKLETRLEYCHLQLVS